MTPTEQLDRLIEQWERGAAPDPVASDEIAARLAAAALAHLQAMAVPSAFAVRASGSGAHRRAEAGRVVSVTPRKSAAAHGLLQPRTPGEEV